VLRRSSRVRRSFARRNAITRGLLVDELGRSPLSTRWQCSLAGGLQRIDEWLG
jgi:hypothetical protein